MLRAAAGGALAAGCGRPESGKESRQGAKVGSREGSREGSERESGREAGSASTRRPSPESSPSGSGSPSRAGLPGQITNGPRDRQAVALTFHGQGESALATALLGEAERAGARITVLAVGSWLDEHPELARRILDAGHELGNHTQSHRAICAMDEKAAHAEITGCAERLRRLTGSQGRWFRPSQARLATPLVQSLARREGYAACLSYDLDSLDHTDPGAEAVQRNVLRQVRPGSVVSLHLGHPGTVAALPALLDGLRGRGLRPVTATELLT
ncbi:polysaccharide deacetylase [Wenjunlia tyrosinilytica]|uniref:Polysaccharide deacetylase n=2 Tax=Wenjunlia tyrosinilytica TaxID=1544741 RepID=A0A917ZC42_9ACTN|nr:polysaccharide deacetylase [Wenjunlia tyrosinilytica]